MKIKKGYHLSRIVVGFILLLSFPFSFSQVRAGPYPQIEPAGLPLISMDFQDVDLKDLLKILSQQAGLNFIASEKVKTRKVTLYLDKVTVQDAMNNIMEANDLTYEQAEGSDIFIVKEAVKPDVEMLTRVFTLKYATVFERKWEEEEGEEEEKEEGDVVGVIRGLLSSHGFLMVDGRTNSLVIIDIPIKFGVIEATIAELDVPSPQVMIEAEIIETSLATVENLGIKWGGTTGELLSVTPAYSALNFPYQQVYEHALGWRGGSGGITAGTLGTDKFAAVLEMLKKDTETKILARPRVLTLNNETAEIRITANTAVGLREVTTGEAAASRTTKEAERIETGTILKVTPTINDENDITLLIEQEVSRVKSSKIDNYWDPHKRTAKGIVMVKDGETIVIAGLISTEDEEVTRKVPFLGDIPILGYLFRKKETYKEDTEIIIFITPHVVRREVSIIKASSPVVEPTSAPPKLEDQGTPASLRKAAIKKAIGEVVAKISFTPLDSKHLTGLTEPDESIAQEVVEPKVVVGPKELVEKKGSVEPERKEVRKSRSQILYEEALARYKLIFEWKPLE